MNYEMFPQVVGGLLIILIVASLISIVVTNIKK
jgi:xanthine/uracil permease